MWPSIRFDPISLFDLRISDLLCHDPYFVPICLDNCRRIGDDLFIGLLESPDVVGYLCEVCADRAAEVRQGIERVRPQSQARIAQAEAAVMEACLPWNLGMAKMPEVWDALPWSHWDPSVIYDTVDLRGRTVIDIGAGTGQVTMRCAPLAQQVYAMEPVARLRRYIERKAGAASLANVLTLSGLAESIPLPDDSVDVSILSNGSFGWNPEAELREMERITRPGGTILMLAPCCFGNDTILRAINHAGGYEPLEFEIPCDGKKPAFVKRT